MNTHHKTKEQLIAELQELQEQNRKLKQLLNANTLDNSLPLIGEDLNFIDFNYFELIYNTSPDIAIISRLSDSKVMKVNDGFTKNTGYTREEALNGTRFNLNLWQNPDDRKLLLDAIQKHGAFENIETTMVRKDGTAFKSLVSARLFEFQGEQYVSSISRDITDLKNGEESLRRSENETQNKFAALNSIFESSQNIIIFSLDVNYCYTAFTTLHKQTMKLIWGVDIAVGMNMLELIQNPIDRKKAKDNFDQVLKGNHLRFEEEYGDSNLHRAFYEDIYNPIIDNNGAIVGLSVFVVDITDRKNAENENERIQTILEESQRIGKIGGWELDIDSMELLWTSEMYAIQELDSTFIPKIDKRQDFFTPESLIAMDDAVKRTIKLGEPYDIEVEITTAKGNRKHIRTIGKLDVDKRKVFGYFQDITEKKLAEQEKKANDELFKHVFDYSNVGKSITSPDGQVNTNKALRDLLGYEFDEIQHVNWKEITHPEDIEQSQNEINRIKKGEVNQVRFSKRFLHKNGSVIWADLSSTALRNKEGELQYLITTIVDITEQKQTEEALRRSEINLKRQNGLFDSLINNLSLGVFMVEAPSGKPLVANPKALNLLGRGILPDANKQNLAEVYKAFKNNTDQSYPVDEMPIIRGMMGEYSQIDDMVVEKPDGTRTQLEIFGSPVKDENGNVWASLVSFSDITERKKAEFALKESEDRYHESQLIGNVAHWEYNLTTEKLYWSDQLYNIYEVLKADFEPDLKKALAFSYVDDQETIRNAYINAINNKSEFSLESRVITPNGRIKTMLTKAKLKLDEKGKPKSLFGTVVDITERKNFEEELKNSQEELRNFSSHLLKVRENERAAITLEIHDSVAQYLVALKMEMGIYINKMMKSRETLNSEQIATRMESFVAQIENTLKSTRMIMNGLRPEQLELLGFIETIEVHLQSFEERHHIKCNFENTLTQLNIEQEKSIVLFRIFQESLINILKHANATKVEVKLSKIKDLLMLEIVDNGVGFDQNQKGKADSFGLVSIKEQVKQMNGTLIITSKIGQGTVVRVEIACD